MISDVVVQGTQKIANYQIHKAYPLMGESHFSETDTRIIVESFLMLLEEWENDVRRTNKTRTRNISKKK